MFDSGSSRCRPQTSPIAGPRRGCKGGWGKVFRRRVRMRRALFTFQLWRGPGARPWKRAGIILLASDNRVNCKLIGHPAEGNRDRDSDPRALQGSCLCLWPGPARFDRGRNRRMELIDRRGFARVILVGAAVAAAGLAAGPGAAIAMPLDDRIPGALDDWIEKAQAVVVTSGPRRRPRRRVRRCWWQRGRRVCGWRWV